MTNIDAGLEALAVPVSTVQPHPENPRRGDVEAIKESLTRFGQVRPIVVQGSSGYVVAGNHTLRAVTELGWDKVAVVVVDLDDEEALSYLLADNRLADRGEYDQQAMAPILERLMLAGKLEGTGYSPDDVDDLLASMDALPEVEPEPTEAGHAATTEDLTERFANRSQVALRQFVMMYDQTTATEVEGMFRRLERAWGMSAAKDVVLEALRRAVAEPPVEGLTPEEAARANAPVPEPSDDTTEGAMGSTGVEPQVPDPAASTPPGYMGERGPDPALTPDAPEAA